MVQILEAPRSFSGELGASLGRGIGAGAGALLSGYLQNKKEQKENERVRDYFGQLAEQHPDDHFYQQMNEVFSSPLPMNQKVQFAQQIMRGGREEDPFKQKQQERLERDSLFRVYSQKIKEIDGLLDNPMLYNLITDEERRQLPQMRHALINQRDALMGLDGSARGQESEFFPEEEEGGDLEDEIPVATKTAPPKKAKPKFDISNPAHLKRQSTVLKKAKGDKAKAAKILAMEFD